MKKTVTLLLLLISITGPALCQKLLILERPGTTKHYVFKTGNRIRLYDGKSMRTIQGNISRISDTMIVINSLEPVYLSRIALVYRPLLMLHKFSNGATIAGIGYIFLTGFNNAINKDTPVIDHQTLISSSILTAAGLATSFIRYRKFAMGPKWRVRVIDLENP